MKKEIISKCTSAEAGPNIKTNSLLIIDSSILNKSILQDIKKLAKFRGSIQSIFNKK